MPTRNVTYLPLADLETAGDDRNPKDHDVDAIARSLTRFGVVDAIATLDARTERIVAGHGRVEALARLRDAGHDPPDGVAVDDDGAWSVPTVVGWASNDDLDSAGALIALNRSTELGGWVDESLLDLLDVLAADDSLHAVGFDTSALDQLRHRIDPTADMSGESKLDGLTLQVVVECDDEHTQRELLDELAGRGLTCRAVML